MVSNARGCCIHVLPVDVLCTRQKIITCSRLLKTGCNNVVLPILFVVVYNILFRHHCIRDPMRLHHACVHQCVRYASSVTRFSQLESKNLYLLSFFSRIFLIKYIQAGTEMSTSNRERQEYSGNAEFSHETGICALAGILQGIQTTLADLFASSKAQTAAFQSIQEDILPRDAYDEDDTAHSTVDPTCVVSGLL